MPEVLCCKMEVASSTKSNVNCFALIDGGEGRVQEPLAMGETKDGLSCETPWPVMSELDQWMTAGQLSLIITKVIPL